MVVTIRFKPRRAKKTKSLYCALCTTALLWIKKKRSILEGFLLLSNKVMHRKRDLPATKKNSFVNLFSLDFWLLVGIFILLLGFKVCSA